MKLYGCVITGMGQAISFPEKLEFNSKELFQTKEEAESFLLSWKEEMINDSKNNRLVVGTIKSWVVEYDYKVPTTKMEQTVLQRTRSMLDYALEGVDMCKDIYRDYSESEIKSKPASIQFAWQFGKEAIEKEFPE